MNTQKPEKLSNSLNELEYVDLFHTVQGEGPFAGRPAVFLRLAGCNLQCKFCDTDYTRNRQTVSVEGMVERIRQLSACRFLVITGGEPLRQKGPVERLINKLTSNFWEVQIETNGTLPIDHLHATVVVSPKTRIHPTCYDFPSKVFFKFLVSADTFQDLDSPLDCNGIDILPAIKVKRNVYIQPLDEGCPVKNKANMKLAISLAMQHDFNVSTQLHKVWGIA